jgi:signal transduction histidine kinase
VDAAVPTGRGAMHAGFDRAVLLMFVVAHLVFYPLYRVFTPDGVDPLWARLVLMTPAVAVMLASLVTPTAVRWHYPTIVMEAYAVTLWICGLCYFNQHQYAAQVGAVLTVAAVLSVLRTWQEAARVYALALFLIACSLWVGGDTRGWLTLMWAALMGGVIIVSTRQRNLLSAALERSRRTLEEKVASRTEELDRRTQELEIEARERRAAEEHALRSSQAKSAFLASMSHELRTPLNAILGYADLIIDEPDDAASIVTDAGHIRSAGAHLLQLVNQVLDLSAIEAGTIEIRAHCVSVRTLFSEVVATVGPLAERHHNTVELHVGPGAGAVTTDPDRLRQILLNLAANAAKYTVGGRVQLCARLEPPWVCFDVIDDGPGISCEQQEKTFERFRPGAGGGAGLGLAISKELAERLGGSLAMDSAVGRGSTFTLRLPMDAAPAVAP